MWTNTLDKIFLINLAKRKDRLEQATEQLNKYNVPFERIEAIEMLDGAEGLRLTMIGIFEKAIENNWQHILVFEDDLDIIESAFNEVMEEVVQQLPHDYDMIYLGGQLCKCPTGFYWTHLMQVPGGVYATHAVMYSLQGIKAIMEAGLDAPIDNAIVAKVQPRNKCYFVYPILVSQIVSKSDIYTSEETMDWKKYIEGKYEIMIKRMKDQNKFNRPQPRKA